MAKLIGYSGFNDIETYEIFSLMENGEYSPPSSGVHYYYPLIKCIKVGVPIDFKAFIETHPNLVGQYPDEANYPIKPSDPSTWVKAYEGIYLSYLVKVNNSTVDPIYDIQFSFDSITYSTIDPQTREAIELVNDSSPILGYRLEFYRYESPAEIGLLHFNFVQDNGSVYGMNGYSFFEHESGGANATIYSAGVGITRVMSNNEEYPTTESTLYKPELSIEQLVQSSDDVDTWYLLMGTQQAIISWSGMEIEPNQGNEGDPSTPDGGDGNYDDEDTDEVPTDGVPTVSALSTGMIVAYHPTITQLNSLASYLFSSNVLETMKKHINDPMSYIISLHAIPVMPNDGTSREITSGNGIFGDLTGSGVVSPTIANQYMEFNCGSLNIMECYGGFLDYDPYTKITIYLPFCGTFTLDTNVVMRSVIQLRYAIDILSGQLVAKLVVTNTHGTENVETYFFSGNCSAQVPMSETSYFGMYSGLIDSIVNVGASIATGGQSSVSMSNSINTMKIDRTRTGNISTQQGFLSNYTPYITIERPAQSFPLYNNKLKGRPSNIGGKAGSFSGYTEIEFIRLNGVKATDSELEEIRQLLADGVYI